MVMKQVIQLNLPIRVGLNIDDISSKIIQCDEMAGLKEILLKEMDSVAHHPQNSVSGKIILTRVALAMGWVKHEFDVATASLDDERRLFILYYDDQFRNIDPELFKLITDPDIQSITPAGTLARVQETYAAVNRKPENLLANFDLVVKNGIGNLFEYIHIPCEHHSGAIGYGENVKYRIMDFGVDPRRYFSNYPFMFHLCRNTVTKVFKTLASKAMARGCKDNYTRIYSHAPTYIKRGWRTGKVTSTGGYDVELNHTTILNISTDGHQTSVCFRFLDDSTIRINIDNKVYFPKLYDQIDDDKKIIRVNPSVLEFIRDLAISKREYRQYAHDNNPRDLKGAVETIPYFFWLEELLKELDAGVLVDWATPKMWAWVESLGFIEKREYPLNTIKRPYITTWLQLQEHGKKCQNPTNE